MTVVWKALNTRPIHWSLWNHLSPWRPRNLWRSLSLWRLERRQKSLILKLTGRWKGYPLTRRSYKVNFTVVHDVVHSSLPDPDLYRLCDISDVDCGSLISFVKKKTKNFIAPQNEFSKILADFLLPGSECGLEMRSTKESGITFSLKLSEIIRFHQTII